MKKRIISLLLTTAMLVTLTFTFAVTVSAVDHLSGVTVDISDLKNGDVLRAGSIVRNGMGSLNLEFYKTTSTTTASNISIIHQIIGWRETWTVPKNYYVVRKQSSSRVYLYEIPSSPITFYPNGGTAGGKTTGSTFPGIRFTSDYYDVSWLNPSRPGCTFLGWYTADGSTMVYNDKGFAVNCSLWNNNIYQGEGAKSLIAKWKANTSVTFRYYPNGGVEQKDNYVEWTASATYFDSYPTDSHWNYTNGTYKLTRPGYTATGYFAKKDGSCPVHEDENFTSYTQLCSAYGLNPDTCGNAVIDIYAQWQPNTYSVSFNGNGANGGSTASQNFVYDKAQNLNNNGFQKKYTVSFDLNDGSTVTSATASSSFKGWNTKADGSGTSYTNQQSVKNLTTDNNASITLYATWTPGSVTLPTPTKTGKICKGWYNSSGVKVGDCGDSYTPSENITLYAQWEALGYTVIWNNYDGTNLETDEGVIQGATPSYDGAEPQKPDTDDKSFVFSGWSPTLSAVTGNVTYTAQFNEIPRQYALTFIFDEIKGELGGSNKASAGSVVTVEVTPKNGYAVKEIIAYKTGDKSTAVDIDSTSYRFTMPAFDVTIEVTWKEAEVINTLAYKDVAPTFTVTIPANVTLGEEITISAENVRLNKGSELVVSVMNTTGSGDAFIMTSAEGDRFEYNITADGTAVTSGARVLTLNPDTASSGDVVLKLEKPQVAIYAGSYTGSLTFTIAVNTADNI